MAPPPTLDTPRLILRPFALADAADVQRLAGDRAIADTTLHIPHPYDDGMAEQWIATHAPAWVRGLGATLAVVERESGTLAGAVGIAIRPEHAHGELGYWIAASRWGRGYCTEAARALLDHAFSVLGLHRVHAMHLVRNPASGRVMQKLGMRPEGTLREHVRKWGVFEDVEKYGVLDREWTEHWERAGTA